MFRLYITYGFWMTVTLIVYFLLIRLIGFHHNIFFSAFNGVIFGFGIYAVIKNLKKKDANMPYEKGFQAGFMSGAVASILFTGFMAVYMFQLDYEFAEAIMRQWNMEDSFSVYGLILTILIMGIVTSLILTFSFMQLFKKSWNVNQKVQDL